MTSSAGPGKPCLGIETTVKDSALWIALRGEADISNLDILDAALNGIALNGNPTVRVDLSDLSFMDLAALRRLTTFATQLRERGFEVVTQDTPPHSSNG